MSSIMPFGSHVLDQSAHLLKKLVTAHEVYVEGGIGGGAVRTLDLPYCGEIPDTPHM